MTTTPKKYLTSYLQHMGKTPEEQLQKNQAAMKLVKRWIEEEISEEESKKRDIYLDSFKKIVDNERLPGHKVYYQE
jgi:hypothetical protein